MEKNFRLCPRAEIRLPVHYKYLEKGTVYHALRGQAKNISAKGLAMLHDGRIERGQNLLLTVFLPPEDGRTGRARHLVPSENEGLPVIILAKVAWCRSFGSGACTAGVEFLVPDPHHRPRFQRFLDDMRVNQAVEYEEVPAADENEP